MEVAESNELAAYSRCKRAHGLPCPPCKYWVELSEKIPLTKDDANHISLISKLAELRTDINSNHEPFIHRLPPEISTNILEMTLSREWYTVEQQHQLKREEQGWPLVLGAVCKTWRRLAWSSPRLWTVMHLRYDVTATELLTPIRLNIAEKWLRRSGQLPLSISIYALQENLSDFRETARAVTQSLIPFASLINRYSHRWQWLDIQVTGAILAILTGNGRAGILDRLRIIEDDMAPAILFGLDGTEPSPRLLSSTLSIVQAVDRRNLVIVQLSQLSHGDILDLLKSAPRLENCELADIDFDPDSYDETCPRFAHEKLNSLKIDCMDSNGNSPLFSKLFLPTLQHLRFEHYYDIFDFTSLIDVALHSKTWSLTSLCLDCRFANDGGLLLFLQHSVLLEEVELNIERESQSMQEIFSLLRHLAATKSNASADYVKIEGAEIFLPKLTRLMIVTTPPQPAQQEAKFLWGLCADIFKPISDIDSKACFRRTSLSLSVEHYNDQDDLPDHDSFISELETQRFEEISKAGISLRLRNIGERGDFDILEFSKRHHAGLFNPFMTVL
ncbi:hypothetical protein JR316_0006689 [Psilocybe cubensis]|uniref:Uncharacterized protein n=2 Tax=Psilocybe cubensis TaxID=181762 RepID=A0ACB8GXC6_PSICU|nr:hypothetical protein JR316_0006689 [Psilocybe cubensis]KAH9480092.1 hypothetical protein JR316_0006689 [Psilocybe cubensis]